MNLSFAGKVCEKFMVEENVYLPIVARARSANCHEAEAENQPRIHVAGVRETDGFHISTPALK